MTLVYLAMVPLSVLGGLWVTLRMRAIDPWARLLSAIIGVAVVGIALQQGLRGRSPVTGAKAIVRPLQPEQMSLGARILPQAVEILLIVVAAMVGLLLFYAAYFALKEREVRVVRSRLRVLLRYVVSVGVYFYLALLPMDLVKRQILHLRGQAIYETTVAYVALISVLLLVAVIVVFDKRTRRHKPAVIAFYCGLVVVAGSSPFVWAVLASAVPAVQSMGVVSMVAMISPGPAYFLLHHRLGWL